MPITLDLTDTTPADIVVQPSPLLEFMAAMHAFTEHDHHPEHQSVAAQLQTGLGDELVERAHYYSPLWSRFRCRLFFVRGIGLASFEAQVADVRAMSDQGFAELAAEGILGMGRTVDHVELLAEPEAFVNTCRRRSSARAELAERLVEDVADFREQLLLFLERAWDAAVRNVWTRSAPTLAATAERIRLQLDDDVIQTVARLSPTAAVIGNSSRIRFDKLDTINFSVHDAPLVLVPSVMHAPHLTIKRAPKGELAIIFPGGAGQDELSLDQLRQRLQCFGSPLRMGILRHLLGEPLSSSELSLRLGIEATQVSRALSRLRSSGIIVSERTGGVISHHADVEAIRRLGLDVLATIMR
ncbi:DNA-binding transcriptional regulator, ArsR family [Brevibacterium sp. 239c]|uniref:DUF5937 family protein n=1 Tax=Brevibacterium sp. 239c TaxID=1965356 RepID=UPI000C461FC1|nr:DUF5937 family protein [Brevibacterium sp. 239c]SMX94958.1 DNA-binding transcriptional regulator, ArsR family [Brevibacterium sp. 239c]